MSTRRHRPRSASVPAALASAPASISEETPPTTRRRSSRKTTVGSAATAADTPDTTVTDVDSATQTPNTKKKKVTKRKSTAAGSHTKKPSTAKKDDEPDSEKRSSRKSPSPVMKRRSSRKSPAAPATPQSPAKNKSKATSAQRSTMKKATRVTSDKNAATPASASKKSSKPKPSNATRTPGSQQRYKRKSSVAFAPVEASPSPSVDANITVAESLQLADADSTAQSNEADDNSNVTPSKRVLVDKNVEVPHGKRLKRTVRVESRKVPVPENLLEQHKLDVSKWECGRLYKDVDSVKLSRTERIAEISRRLITSVHFQNVASLSDSDAKRITDVVSESLKTAPEEPAARKNPENARLRNTIKELEAKREEQTLSLRRWDMAEKVCAEMERNPVIIPVEPANAEQNKNMGKKGEADTKKALEYALLQCSAMDVKLTKLDRIAYEADMKVKAAVDIFNEYVKRTSKLPKTPRKPSAFPRGGEVVAETPRGPPGGGIF